MITHNLNLMNIKAFKHYLLLDGIDIILSNMTRTTKIFRYKIVKDGDIYFCNDHQHVSEVHNIPRSSLNCLVSGKKMPRKYPNIEITRCKLNIDEVKHYTDIFNGRPC